MNQFLNHNEKLKKDYETLVEQRSHINWDIYLNVFPKTMQFFPNGMPRKQFVGWKFTLNEDGRVSKIPVDLNHSTKGNIKLAKANEEYLCCFEYKKDENNKVILIDGNFQKDKTKYHPTWIKNAYTWSTLEFAVKKAKQLGEIDGIGFETGCGICAIDIDSCIDSNGKYNDIAKDITKHFDTTTFISPSGTGLHLYFFFKPTPEVSKYKTKTPEVEAYISRLDKDGCYIPPAHFFAEKGTPAKKENWKLISANKSNILFLEIMKKYLFPSKEENDKKEKYLEFLKIKLNEPAKDNSLGLSVDEIINKLKIFYKRIKKYNGGLNKFNEMYEFGNWQPFLPEIAKKGLGQSDADLVFCKMIPFYTDSYNQIDFIVRNSKMMRKKWDKPINSSGLTYGKRTIMIALSQFKNKNKR